MRKSTALSLVIACCIVAGAIWIFGRSLPRANPANMESSIEATATLAIPSTTGKLEKHDVRQGRESVDVAQRSQQSGIFKCVVAGRVVYSDVECPSKSAQRNLVLNDSAGFVSPLKESVEHLTVGQVADKTEYKQQAPVQIATAGSHKMECEALEKYIQGIDSSARQPQSGQTMDWLRQERTKATDRKFVLHC
jgi:hypothetical protein